MRQNRWGTTDLYENSLQHQNKLSAVSKNVVNAVITIK